MRALLLMALVLPFAAVPALADVYVVESSVLTITAGTRLADDATISIPAGGQIRAVLPSGKTQTIRGPFNGSVADLAKGQARNEGVLVWLRGMLQTGGATESTPGATRSTRRAPEATRAPFSWSQVPVADATVCVEKGAALQLVRGATQQPDRVVVVDAANAGRGEAQWEVGSQTAPWPATVKAVNGGIYELLMPERPVRQITLRVLDRLPGDDDVLAELQEKGCRMQFEAWVRERLDASKGGRG